MTPTKSCLQCGQLLHGRLDKKFCDDQCRSHFNNQLNSDVSSTMRNINYILRKNRRIMAAILPPSGKTKISKDKLIEIGFDFRFITHYHQNHKGRIYKACYDYGYLPLESNQISLIHCNDKKTGRSIITNEKTFMVSEELKDLVSIEEPGEKLEHPYRNDRQKPLIDH